jgi:hypothetical protein
MDKIRHCSAKRLEKFLFGAYAFEAMVPIITKPVSKTELTLKRISNCLLIAFYLLLIFFFLIIWLRYK